MTQPDPVVPLTWADAWLLHAVVVAGGGGPARLSDVIRAGDMINHAVFTLAELDGGVTRLMRAGLLTMAEKELVPDRTVVAFIAGLRTRRVYEVGERLREHVGASAYRPGTDPNACDPAWRSGVVTAEDLHLAYLAGTPQSHE